METGKIDPRPYMRIAAVIRDQIASGALAPGCQVPTLAVLAHDHRTSRQTAGKALQLLEAEGVIWRVPGTGYHVIGLPAAEDTGRTWRCSCGTQFDDMPGLEDHLFVFPEEDQHYELTQDWHQTEHAASLAGIKASACPWERKPDAARNP